MRVNPGTGRIYQLSPTSRMGSTPLPRATAPLPRPVVAAPAPTKPRSGGFLSGVKNLLKQVGGALSGLVGAVAGLFSRPQVYQLEASGRGIKTGGGGTGTV
jgi:hypothetical protein